MAWTNTYDTTGLEGTDPISDIDNEVQALAKAIQERLNDGVDGADEGDMYFPLTGTEGSDTEIGEKRKITLRERALDPGGGGNDTNKGYLYTKEADSKTEFFLKSEALTASQITHGGGKLFPTPHQAAGTDDINLDAALDTWTDMADMTLTITTIGGDALVSFNAAISAGTSSDAFARLHLRILLDDVEQIRTTITITPMSGYASSIPTSFQFLCESLSAAEHTWKVQYYRVKSSWNQNGNTYKRILNVIEYRP